MAIVLSLLMIFSISIVSYASTRTEVESNDTRSTADIAYLGDILKGTMKSASDIDCWKLVPNQSGKLSITLTSPSGYYYNLWLQDNNGAELASTTALSTTKSIQYTVTSGVPYYIVINKSSQSGYSTTNQYTLSVGNISSVLVDEV